jgi:hypothetical protein
MDLDVEVQAAAAESANSLPMFSITLLPINLTHPQTVVLMLQATDADGDTLSFSVLPSSLSWVQATISDSTLTLRTLADVTSDVTATFTVQVHDELSSSARAVRLGLRLTLMLADGYRVVCSCKCATCLLGACELKCSAMLRHV